jgi:CRP/FNR family transcriptional regulator, anaerobic regulatory protein
MTIVFIDFVRQESALTSSDNGSLFHRSPFSFGHSLSERDRSDLNGITRRRRVRRGDCIYRVSDVFENLYIVKSGSVKTTILSVGGCEQVIGFYLSGELFGLDGIVDKHCNSTTVALEDAEIDEIPFERLEKLCIMSCEIRHLILKLASKQIALNGTAMLIGRVTADQRFAGFLYDFSVRHSLLGHSGTLLQLPMSRYDISSYLCLTSECVSRVITKFKHAGLIEVNYREVRLLDVATLKLLAEGASDVMPLRPFKKYR